MNFKVSRAPAKNSPRWQLRFSSLLAQVWHTVTAVLHALSLDDASTCKEEKRRQEALAARATFHHCAHCEKE